jgi:phospholipase/carboxylesterase
VVPMALGTKSRDYLKAQGYKVEWRDYPMAHAVCAEEVADIRQFLIRVLP